MCVKLVEIVRRPTAPHAPKWCATSWSASQVRHVVADGLLPVRRPARRALSCGAVSCASCVRANWRRGAPAFDGCGRYDAFAQDGRRVLLRLGAAVLLPAAARRRPPRDAPRLPERDVCPQHARAARWVNSVTNWNTMRSRLRRCGTAFADGALVTDNDLVRAWARAPARLAVAHALPLLEVDVEAEDAGARLARPPPSQQAAGDVPISTRTARGARCSVGDSLLRYLGAAPFAVPTGPPLDSVPVAHSDLVARRQEPSSGARPSPTCVARPAARRPRRVRLRRLGQPLPRGPRGSGRVS